MNCQRHTAAGDKLGFQKVMLRVIYALWRSGALLTGLWCCGLTYWFMEWQLYLTLLLGVLLMILLISSFFTLRALIMLTAAELSMVTFFVLVTPQQMFGGKKWTRSCEKIASVTAFSPLEVTISGIRDFRYRTPDDFDVRYRTEKFKLSQLQSLDVAQSHWDEMYEVSHTLFCFNFSDGRKLAVSFEPRVPEGMRGGQFFPGIYKRYALMLLLSTPSDIFDLRTKYRGETFYLYRTALSRSEIRELFMLIVGKAAKLEKNPEFYNSISVNCTTAFAPMIRQIDPEFPSDIRLIFNGYFDRLLFEAGYLKRRESESFGSLKSRSYIPGKSSGI